MPGGPYSKTPFGIFAPTAWNFAGCWRNSLISPSSSIASSHPATSEKVVFGWSLLTSFALDLANCMTRPPPPCMLFMMNRKIKTISTIGKMPTMNDQIALVWGTSTS